MSRARKIAITVDAALLAEAERLRVVSAESRSAFFARALRELLRAEERRRNVERYVEAYREQPEIADADASALERFAVDALGAVPWEDG